ncbi:zygote arrest protein 1 [Lissotriton helveticus]
MATISDEAMDSYMYSAYTPYNYRYLNPKGKGGGWRQRGYLASYADTGEYFDNYQRAQLKAILSQVNPNLTPRLRKANTRDVGVQVNPRQDASVQCSLGPRTLSRRRRGVWRQAPQEPDGTPASSPPKTVRFPRTVAVYSPVASRRLPTFTEEEDAEAKGGGEVKPESGESSGARPAEEKGSPAEGSRADRQEEASLEEEKKPEQKAEGDAAAEPGQQETTASPDKGRLRFQFLEQKYGFYHCKECNIRWESAYVWCVQGTNKVYFRQFCRACQKTFNPYRVEDITCQSCKQTRCTCPVKLRHVDPKRPHRQDLCGRCKGKRLSCDSTFSFKYII